VTSSDTISNDAPDRCHPKKGGQVSPRAAMSSHRPSGGGTSNITRSSAWSALRIVKADMPERFCFFRDGVLRLPTQGGSAAFN
jgi:hypothetical protein